MPAPHVPPELDATSFTRELQAVLAAPPFAEVDAPTLFDRIEQGIVDAIMRLSLPSGRDLANHPLLFFASVLLLVSVTAWLLRFGRARLRRLWPRKNPQSSSELPRESGVLDLDLTAARAALARGDARHAIERLWQEVAALGGHAPDSALTPRQKLRLLSARVAPPVYAELSLVLWAHERACYAGDTPTLVEVSRLIESLAALRRRQGKAWLVSQRAAS